MKILVTSGATREPIDSVRFISNISTGSTGAAIAETLAEAGHSVTLLGGVGSVHPRGAKVECLSFGSTEDLALRTRSLLTGGDYATVIQAAAISDYRPDTTHHAKLTSDAAELVIRLVPTPKLLPQLKSWSPRPLRVVGFKLTQDGDASGRDLAVAKLFARGSVDAVVHNDVRSLETQGQRRAFRVYNGGLASWEDLSGLPALLAALTRWVHSPSA